MASRAEQKAAARAAREAAHRDLSAAQARRMRLIWLGGLVAAAALAIVIVIVATQTGGGTIVKESASAKAAAVTAISSELAGIPQQGNVLGKPSAPVTVTEYGDLICSTCDAFALSSEAQLITNYVKTGKVKLVYRADDTASSYANQGEFVTGQVGAKAAGLQNKAWYYILLNYQEQPASINGTAAESVPYFTPGYIQGLASQIKGLNLIKWQANLTNATLINAVTADGHAASAAGVVGTPAVFVKGPKGTLEVPTQPGVPQYSNLQSLIQRVS